jgi:hypothetical protein
VHIRGPLELSSRETKRVSQGAMSHLSFLDKVFVKGVI